MAKMFFVLYLFLFACTAEGDVTEVERVPVEMIEFVNLRTLLGSDLRGADHLLDDELSVSTNEGFMTITDVFVDYNKTDGRSRFHFSDIDNFSSYVDVTTRFGEEPYNIRAGSGEYHVNAVKSYGYFIAQHEFVRFFFDANDTVVAISFFFAEASNAIPPIIFDLRDNFNIHSRWAPSEPHWVMRAYDGSYILRYDWVSYDDDYSFYNPYNLDDVDIEGLQEGRVRIIVFAGQDTFTIYYSLWDGSVYEIRTTDGEPVRIVEGGNFRHDDSYLWGLKPIL